MTGRPQLAAVAAAFVLLVPAASAQQSEWQDVIRNLRHPEVQTRLDAVTRLGNAAYTPAAEAVSPLVMDPDDRVQAAAIDAELSFFLTERLTSTRILGMGGSRTRAQQAFELGVLGRSATRAPELLFDRLVAAMRDENPRVRFDAVHALGFVAEAPIDPRLARALADELEHYDPIMRAATARVLGRLAVRGAGERLEVALTDSSSIVRLQAIEALGLLRDRAAVEPLRNALSSARGELATALVLALARIGAPEDRDLLRSHLASRTATLRRAAAEGLGRIGDRDSRQSIAQLLATNSADEVRLAAAFALEKFGERQAHVIASLVWRNTTEQARDYLLELGVVALPAVVAVLKNAPDVRQRADLVYILGHIGTAAEIDVLTPYRTERDERVSRAAINAVERIRRRTRPTAKTKPGLFLRFT